jgi:exonuclease SbcC
MKGKFSTESLDQYIRLSREHEKINREAKHIDLSLTSILNEKLKLQIELGEVQIIVTNKEKDIAVEEQIINGITKGKNPTILLKTMKDELQAQQNQLKIWQSKEKEHLSGISDFEGRLKMANEQIEDLAVQIKKNTAKFTESSTQILSQKYTFFEIDPAYERIIEMLSGKLRSDLPADQLDLENFSFFLLESEKAFLQMKDLLHSKDQNLIIASTKLELYEKNAVRSADLYKEIEQLNEKLTRKKNLYQVMGKDEFRTFLLSMVERQLLVLANNELKSLCGERYVLIQSSRKNTITPEFSVLDRFSGGMKRNILTLSGGETFMLSLALALGLAEMTRGQAEINCFFIDEGFGTLDSDSIEEVLNVLLAMKDQGKQIGIISHIKALTDRIAVNVKLTKNSTGSSRLDYFYND